MKEIWKAIPGVYFYEASHLGRIRSLPRNTTSGKVLSLGNKNGYLFFVASPSKQIYVHRAVCSAFFGDRSGMDVNHRNGNRHDNHIRNLEWCTRSENVLHAQRTGLRKTKLSNNDVRTIRFFYSNARGRLATTGILAKIYRVQPQMIRTVATTGYRHVD